MTQPLLLIGYKPKLSDLRFEISEPIESRTGTSKTKNVPFIAPTPINAGISE